MHVNLEALPFLDAMKTFAVLFEGDIDVLAVADEDEGALILEAGRNGVYIKYRLEANIIEEGESALSCIHFTQLRFSRGASVELQSDGKRMSFKSGKLKGKIACKASVDDIESQRPLTEFEAEIALPAEVFRTSVDRAAFTSALPNTTHGVRIQSGEDICISTTDHYRASLYKETLAVPQDEIDIILKPSFIQTVLSRAKDDLEIRIGAHKGIFKFETDTLELYHPTIQSEPEDIEAWIKEGIDYSARKCVVGTTVEDVTQVIDSASSIAVGSLGFDTHIDVLIKGQKLLVRVQADHGDAQSSMKLSSSDAKKHVTKLSSRYVLEMLRLVKAGDMEIGFWDDFIMLQANSGKFTALIPTIAA